jgi:hypothetical protein
MASRPLTAWLTREFEPKASVGGWEFRMRRGSRATLVYQGQWLEAGGVVIELPSLGHDAVARLEVVDLDVMRTLADSARGSGVVVVDESGAVAPAVAGLDVSRHRRLMMRGPIAAPSSDHAFVAVRLLARDGRSLAVVPVAGTAALDATSAKAQDSSPR